MERGDDWFAVDKLEHVIFCFTIALFISTLLNSQTRYSLRRWSIPIGALASIAAGVAKEIGDEIGLLWVSSGASFKDLVADLIGTVVAATVLVIHRSLSKNTYTRTRKSDEETGIQLV